MLIATLIVLNTPIYLLIGWLVFDDGQGAADSFTQTIYNILKAIFVPQFMRPFLDDPDEGPEMFLVFAFFVACIAVVCGEYYLITKYVL